MKSYPLLRSILIGFLCAIPAYWLNAYNEMTLLGIHVYWILSLAVLVASAWISRKSRMSVARVVVTLCTGVMLGVVSRIGYDVIRDPTTHNLFPFEILATQVVAMVSAFTGTFLAGVFRRSGLG